MKRYQNFDLRLQEYLGSAYKGMERIRMKESWIPYFLISIAISTHVLMSVTWLGQYLPNVLQQVEEKGSLIILHVYYIWSWLESNFRATRSIKDVWRKKNTSLSFSFSLSFHLWMDGI